MKKQKVTYNKELDMKKNQNIIDNGNGTVTISGKCVFIGEKYSVTVNENEYNKWVNGELIQRAMPNVSVEDREFLISGISPKGWKKTFGG